MDKQLSRLAPAEGPAVGNYGENGWEGEAGKNRSFFYATTLKFNRHPNRAKKARHANFRDCGSFCTYTHCNFIV